MIGIMLPTVKILSDNVRWLLEHRGPHAPRQDQARRMDIGDKTLGFLKSGTGNPTLDVLEKVASFYRIDVWQLLTENGPAQKTVPSPELASSLSDRALHIVEKLTELQHNDKALDAIESVLRLASSQDSASIDPSLYGLAAAYLKDPKSLSKESFVLLNKQLARHTDNLTSSEGAPLAPEQQKKETGS